MFAFQLEGAVAPVVVTDQQIQSVPHQRRRAALFEVPHDAVGAVHAATLRPQHVLVDGH
jgi:hypothetical protein